MKTKRTRDEDLALKVSNDISEGIDGGESKEQLRRCISVWADWHNEAAITISGLKTTVLMLKVTADSLKHLAAEIDRLQRNGEK